MNILNDKYIAKDLDEVLQILHQEGKKVEVKRLEPKKDKDILNQEIVIKVEEHNNFIRLVTAMFKKYI